MPVSNAISKFEIGNLFTRYINTQTNSYIINPNGQFNLACKHTKTQQNLDIIVTTRKSARFYYRINQMQQKSMYVISVIKKRGNKFSYIKIDTYLKDLLYIFQTIN